MSILPVSLAIFFLIGSPAHGDPHVQGIDNFHWVDEHVCRGGQPTASGFRYLAKSGIKTVLDLRKTGDRSDRERTLVTSLGMNYINVPMKGLRPPTNAEITRILLLLEAPKGGVVFVHCKRGADRTGAVIAAYRIDHDHWDNRRALRESMSMGMSYFQLPRQYFILKFQPLLSIEAPKT